MKMYLWAAIDPRDKYERIVAVADSADELAEKLGITRNAIYIHRSLVKRGMLRERYLKIEIPDDDEGIQELEECVEYARDTGLEVSREDWLKYQAESKVNKDGSSI